MNRIIRVNDCLKGVRYLNSSFIIELVRREDSESGTFIHYLDGDSKPCYLVQETIEEIVKMIDG